MFRWIYNKILFNSIFRRLEKRNLLVLLRLSHDLLRKIGENRSSNENFVYCVMAVDSVLEELNFDKWQKQMKMEWSSVKVELACVGK